MKLNTFHKVEQMLGFIKACVCLYEISLSTYVVLNVCGSAMFKCTKTVVKVF